MSPFREVASKLDGGAADYRERLRRGDTGGSSNVTYHLLYPLILLKRRPLAMKMTVQSKFAGDSTYGQSC
jgi:hypothetical protein